MKSFGEICQSSTVRRWVAGLAIWLFLVGFLVFAFAQDKPEGMQERGTAVQVVRDAVAAGIDNREPVETGQAFPPSVERLYYFTEVRTPSPPAEITHVWYHEDREVARIRLAVQAPTWRTWSSKRIPAGATGSWKVEAIGPEGAILGSKVFSVEQASATPEPRQDQGK